MVAEPAPACPKHLLLGLAAEVQSMAENRRQFTDLMGRQKGHETSRNIARCQSGLPPMYICRMDREAQRASSGARDRGKRLEVAQSRRNEKFPGLLQLLNSAKGRIE